MRGYIACVTLAVLLLAGSASADPDLLEAVDQLGSWGGDTGQALVATALDSADDDAGNAGHLAWELVLLSEERARGGLDNAFATADDAYATCVASQAVRIDEASQDHAGMDPGLGPALASGCAQVPAVLPGLPVQVWLRLEGPNAGIAFIVAR